MKKEHLKQLLNQIKKYKLTKLFNNSTEFDKWLNSLSIKQIKNLNNLTIEPDKTIFIKKLLINENLLNCDDYEERINKIVNLKIDDDCINLLDNLASSNFLNSNNYYKDMELLATADYENLRVILSIINKNGFINSKYHLEDLKLIIDTKDEKNFNLWVKANSLATVASDTNSINSQYHQQDMNLIFNAKDNALQLCGSFPKRSMNNLAINEISLKDKYHLENMKILEEASNKSLIQEQLLYAAMTNEKLINSKNYRTEINALTNAKSKYKAMAIFCYITNIKHSYTINNTKFYNIINEFLRYNKYDVINTSLLYENNNENSENNNLNYLNYLNLLNEIDDQFVLYIESILSNKTLFESGHQEFDIELLLKTSDKNTFMDLFKVMIDKDSLKSPTHREDLNIISKTTDEDIRKLLVRAAINQHNINSPNHQYDMQYISRLNLDEIDDNIFYKIKYFLYQEKGINHPNHQEILENSLKKEFDYQEQIMLKHLESIEHQLNNENNNDNKNEHKILSRIRKILKIQKKND